MEKTKLRKSNKEKPVRTKEKNVRDNLEEKTEILPTQELNKWLKEKSYWNHDEWLQLLNDLKEKGYGELVIDQQAIDSIGLYLEKNRR